MKTAILISGQIRTFAQCYPSHRWHVYRHFPDPHFFITVQDEPALNDKLKALRSDFGEDHMHLDVRTDPDLRKEVPGLWSLVSGPAFDQAPYANAAPAHQLLLQHWYQSQVWKLFQSIVTEVTERSPQRSGRIESLPVSEPVSFKKRKPETQASDHCTPSPTSSSRSRATSVRSVTHSEFDTIIRIRPDQFFHSFDISHSPFVIGDKVALTPWWGRFGGVNDRLAILGRDAARAYFTVYEQIPALLAKGCPFHPESLVKAALLENGCTLHETLRTEFTTWRADGNHRPPEIMGCDIAHAALRAA